MWPLNGIFIKLLINLVFFNINGFSQFHDSPFGHFDQINTAQHWPQIVPDGLDSLNKLHLPQTFLCFLDSLAQDPHQLVVVSFIVLEMRHELEVLCQQIWVVRQIVKVIFYQLFGVLVVFVVPDDEMAVLDQCIGQSLWLMLVDWQKGVVQLLGSGVGFLTDLELNVTLVCLKCRCGTADLLVHLPGLNWVFSFLQVTPVEVQLSAELDKERLVVP